MHFLVKLTYVSLHFFFFAFSFLHFSFFFRSPLKYLFLFLFLEQLLILLSSKKTILLYYIVQINCVYSSTLASFLILLNLNSVFFWTRKMNTFSINSLIVVTFISEVI